MRSTTVLLIGATTLLFAMQASSEEFTILEGEFIDAASGDTEALTGRLEIRPADEVSEDVYYVDDFELETDSETFGPNLAIEYDGQQALLLQIANQIRDGGDGASFFYLRSGGHLVGAEGDEVTFRFFDFRSSWIPVGGTPLPIRLAGLDPSRRPRAAPAAEFERVDIPRRFDLHGTLEQVDQRFRILGRDCPELPTDLLPPFPRDGAVIISQEPPPVLFPRDGAVIIAGEPPPVLFPRDGAVISAREPPPVLFPRDGAVIIARDSARPLPRGGAVLIARDSARADLAGGGFTIGDTGTADPTPRFQPFDPSGAGLSWNHQIVNWTVTPTLEDLHITAPQGAEISLAEDGSLSVYTRGDLYLDGPIPELQGVERLDITAEGAIIVAATFEPPVAATLELNSGTNDDPLSPNPVTCGFLSGLRPISPVETLEVGSFSMTASAAPETVGVELLSRRKPYRLQLRSRKPVWLALFGSETLDVSEVDRSSLRLGPDGGEPVHRFGRPLVLPWDWNRDGHRDLLAVFLSRGLGVRYGEDELCLQAETELGQRLEGCDEIETRRRRSRRPSEERDRHERRHRH